VLSNSSYGGVVFEQTAIFRNQQSTTLVFWRMCKFWRIYSSGATNLKVNKIDEVFFFN
jgi:hypothetical protein